MGRLFLRSCIILLVLSAWVDLCSFGSLGDYVCANFSALLTVSVAARCRRFRPTTPAELSPRPPHRRAAARRRRPEATTRKACAVLCRMELMECPVIAADGNTYDRSRPSRTGSKPARTRLRLPVRAARPPRPHAEQPRAVDGVGVSRCFFAAGVSKLFSHIYTGQTRLFTSFARRSSGASTLT